MPIVSRLTGRRFKGKNTRSQRPFKFFVVDHHHNALRAGDSALPRRGNMTSVAFGEVFNARHDHALPV